jgi:dihydropteroate synthase
VNAKRALQLGAHIINDQSGLENPAMVELMAATKSPCVIMHQLSLPASAMHRLPRHENPITPIKHWAETKINALLKANIALENIIFDPGIGFGKAPEQSLAILQSLESFKTLNTKLLIGHSRKSFMTIFTPEAPPARDLETALFSIALANQPIDYLRVHNIDFTARALKIASLWQPLQTTQK